MTMTVLPPKDGDLVFERGNYSHHHPLDHPTVAAGASGRHYITNSEQLHHMDFSYPSPPKFEHDPPIADCTVDDILRYISLPPTPPGLDVQQHMSELHHQTPAPPPLVPGPPPLIETVPKQSYLEHPPLLGILTHSSLRTKSQPLSPHSHCSYGLGSPVLWNTQSPKSANGSWSAPPIAHTSHPTFSYSSRPVSPQDPPLSQQHLPLSASEAATQLVHADPGALHWPPTLHPGFQASYDPCLVMKQKRRLCTCPNCVNGVFAKLDRKKKHNCHYPNCNKVYGKTSHLRAHLRSHTGERPFLCSWPYCFACFTRSDELQRHIRTHTGEKKFACQYCCKRFMRTDHLSKHITTHQRKKRGWHNEKKNSELGSPSSEILLNADSPEILLNADSPECSESLPLEETFTLSHHPSSEPPTQAFM